MAYKVGNDSKNTLNGTANADVIIGNGGNDKLKGKAGDDLYIYHPGDGNDTITDTSGNDLLYLEDGIWMVDHEKVGNNLVLSFYDIAGSLTIKDFYLNPSNFIESIMDDRPGLLSRFKSYYRNCCF
jgi:hypothetical protein